VYKARELLEIKKFEGGQGATIITLSFVLLFCFQGPEKTMLNIKNTEESLSATITRKRHKISGYGYRIQTRNRVRVDRTYNGEFWLFSV
jgi:hypothetical protein